MNVYTDRKEVGTHSGHSGHSGPGPLARMRARFSIVPTPPALADVPPSPAEAEAAPVAAPPARVPPGFPPDAVIVVADEHAHYPDDRRFTCPYVWTWIDAPTWFYVKDFPVPDARLRPR